MNKYVKLFRESVKRLEKGYLINEAKKVGTFDPNKITYAQVINKPIYCINGDTENGYDLILGSDGVFLPSDTGSTMGWPMTEIALFNTAEEALRVAKTLFDRGLKQYRGESIVAMFVTPMILTQENVDQFLSDVQINDTIGAEDSITWERDVLKTIDVPLRV